MNSRESTTIKLSFVGDIMCEKKQIDLAYVGNGDYDFTPSFSYTKEILADSDYVVGNLEVPLAGEDAKYTSTEVSFNAPNQFAKDLKESGFSLLTTANNHCLDRGISGLFKTIDTLDEYSIDHIGTYKNKSKRDEPFIKNIKGIKVAFISYTYGTNSEYNNIYLNDLEDYAVNLLKDQDVHINKYNLIKRMLRKANLLYKKQKLKLKNDIKKAKDGGADLVILCLHSGYNWNAFNIDPDSFTKHIVRYAQKNGVDVIIGSHPHVVQSINVDKEIKRIVAYSLGNYLSVPNSLSTPLSHLAHYGILLNLYITKVNDLVTIDSIGIIPTVITDDEIITIKSLYNVFMTEKNEEKRKQLIIEHNKIMSIVIGKDITINNTEINEEYIISI